MERLSEGAIELNDIEVFNNCSYSCYMNIADALNQLKTYEDTGLEPGDVISNIKTLSNELNNALEELKEYRDLEEQGLLIKLPCKIGSKIFHIAGMEYQGITGLKNTYRVEEVFLNKNNLFAVLKRWNEKAFLTQEEAEKALESDD